VESVLPIATAAAKIAPPEWTKLINEKTLKMRKCSSLSRRAEKIRKVKSLQKRMFLHL
jgi:hypothetical protein